MQPKRLLGRLRLNLSIAVALFLNLSDFLAVHILVFFMSFLPKEIPYLIKQVPLVRVENCYRDIG